MIFSFLTLCKSSLKVSTAAHMLLYTVLRDDTYNVQVWIQFRFENGYNRLHPVNIVVRCQHNLYFLWDNFKHISDSHFLESLCNFMIMVLSCFDLVAVATNHPGLFLYVIFWLRETFFFTRLLDISRFCCCIRSIFFPCTFRDEHRTISGSLLSIFSSQVSTQTQIANSARNITHFSGYFARDFY